MLVFAKIYNSRNLNVFTNALIVKIPLYIYNSRNLNVFTNLNVKELTEKSTIVEI